MCFTAITFLGSQSFSQRTLPRPQYSTSPASKYFIDNNHSFVPVPFSALLSHAENFIPPLNQGMSLWTTLVEFWILLRSLNVLFFTVSIRALPGTSLLFPYYVVAVGSTEIDKKWHQEESWRALLVLFGLVLMHLTPVVTKENSFHKHIAGWYRRWVIIWSSSSMQKHSRI